MTTYTFRIEVEPDEDAWHAYCPALVKCGGATWGENREEALKNIRQVIEMIVADLLENDEHLPEDVRVSSEALVPSQYVTLTDHSSAHPKPVTSISALMRDGPGEI